MIKPLKLSLLSSMQNLLTLIAKCFHGRSTICGGNSWKKGLFRGGRRGLVVCMIAFPHKNLRMRVDLISFSCFPVWSSAMSTRVSSNWRKCSSMGYPIASHTFSRNYNEWGEGVTGYRGWELAFNASTFSSRNRSLIFNLQNVDQRIHPFSHTAPLLSG